MREASPRTIGVADSDGVVIACTELSMMGMELGNISAPEGAEEFKKFQKKLIEHEILLFERNYFNEREKRIVKVFGARPFSILPVDPKEEAFRMKAYSALQSTVIQRQEAAIEAELERRFPKIEIDNSAELRAEAEAQALLEKQRAEMEAKYAALLNAASGEVQVFQEEERRKEEARREAERLRLLELKRQEEERLRQEAERLRREAEARAREAEARARAREMERRRLEQAAFVNRIKGIYVANCGGDKYTIEMKSDTEGFSFDRYSSGQKDYISYQMYYDGNTIQLREISKRQEHYHGVNARKCFYGNLNRAGTMISGYWYDGNEKNNEMYYYKR
jgi:hypothetical protein